MSCWCEELNYKCINCESKEKYNSLNKQNREVIKFFFRKTIRHKDDSIEMRDLINKFEKKNGCWVDYIHEEILGEL